MSAPVLDPAGVNVAAGCPWWNLVCQGGEQVADSGLTAITQATAKGLVALFGGIVKVVDESTKVPLTDATYRDVYSGFVVLAVPIIVIIYMIAILAAVLRRDPGTLTRATVGVVVAAAGGSLYIVFAQLIVALDDWLAHGVVAVTGEDFSDQMSELAAAFDKMGASGAVAANMLMLVLMFVALFAGVTLWIVLLLRQMAILVVVVFAPFLVAGWLWAPTRSWARKATETLIALTFSKTVIYVMFGLGMRLFFNASEQSLSSFVGAVVLLCGACFAPLVMLRLVHFAADSQLAGEMVGSLKAGAQPVMDKLNKIPMPSMGGSGGRGQMANDYATGGPGGGATVGGPTGYGSEAAGSMGVGSASAGSQAAGAGASGGAAAAGAGVAGVAVVAKEKADGIVQDTRQAVSAPVDQLAGMSAVSQPRQHAPDDHSGPTGSGPDLPRD